MCENNEISEQTVTDDYLRQHTKCLGDKKNTDYCTWEGKQSRLSLVVLDIRWPSTPNKLKLEHADHMLLRGEANSTPCT